MRLFVKIAVTGLSVTLSTSAPTLADSALNCDAYADAAVAQQRENLALGCGYDNGAWHGNRADHKAWCQRADVKMANLTEQDGGRAGALDVCRSKAQACDAYANLAVLQNKFNLSGGCGLQGGAWSDNRAGHRNWCMGAAPEASQKETTARAELLGGCSGQLATIDLQQATQRQQQVLQMMGNISKMLHGTSANVISKIGR